MPRQVRVNAPWALHDVMGRRNEGICIFRSDEDREDFLTWLGAFCEGEAQRVLARALIENHFREALRSAL